MIDINEDKRDYLLHFLETLKNKKEISNILGLDESYTSECVRILYDGFRHKSLEEIIEDTEDIDLPF